MHTFETLDAIAVQVELVVGSARIEASDRPDTVVIVEPTHPERSGDVTAACISCRRGRGARTRPGWGRRRGGAG